MVVAARHGELSALAVEAREEARKNDLEKSQPVKRRLVLDDDAVAEDRSAKAPFIHCQGLGDLG